MISSHLDAALEYRRALSLLSNNSWASCGQESIPIHNHPMHGNETQPTMMHHPIPEGVPLSSEFWLTGHQSTHPRLQSLAPAGSYQEIHLLTTPPCETDFYSNMLN